MNFKIFESCKDYLKIDSIPQSTRSLDSLLNMIPSGAEDNDIDITVIALTITKKQNQRCIGAAVQRRQPRSNMQDPIQYSLELFDFFDNEQFSGVSLETAN